MKKEITEKQIAQFNKMRNVLLQIAKQYQTPAQLRRNCEKQYGLDFEETIEMAYENIQSDAKDAINGIKAINI